MNLLVSSLKQAIADVAERKGIKSPRVLSKVNAHGEVVIALILPRDLTPDVEAPPRKHRRI